MADVLNALSIESLQDLYFHDHPDQRGEDQKPKKKEIIDAIKVRLEKLAIDIVVASLSVKDLKALAPHVNFKEGENKSSRHIISHHLAEQIPTTGAGLDEFLKSTATDAVRASLADDFDLDKGANAKAIAEQARAFAAERYFSGFDVESLRALAEDLKLKNAASSVSKRKLVDAIVSQEDAEAEPKKKKQKTEVDLGKKKPLEKGITYDEIFQHYYAQDLKDFVKKHGIKASGKKPILIKRIIAYLEGNTEGIMAGDKSHHHHHHKKSSQSKKAAGSTKKGKENGTA